MTLRDIPKWTAAQANEWFKTRPWYCGFNFLPSSAVNFLDMWQADSFDKDCIDRELSWAANVGFNAARVNLHFLVWKHDRDGLIERMNWFLNVANQKGITTIFVPFDDCGFCGDEPIYGGQRDPIDGVHNSRAVASPGRAAVMDRTQWPMFKAYLQDIITCFRADPRILFWDLYNEPGNRMIFLADDYRLADPDLEIFSRELMLQSFQWARECNPEQPLTVGAWQTAAYGSAAPDFDNETDRLALELSDIVTFHAYLSRDRVQRCIETLTRFDRPIFLTEWMARAVGSSIDTQMDLFFDHHIGCFNWGLVKGKTQTDLPWPRPLLEQHGLIKEDCPWFHDIFWPDGRPYREAEIQIIQKLTTAQHGRVSAGE